MEKELGGAQMVTKQTGLSTGQTKLQPTHVPTPRARCMPEEEEEEEDEEDEDEDGGQSRGRWRVLTSHQQMW